MGYKIKFKLYDWEVTKKPLQFVNHYLVLLLDQNDKFKDAFYLSDWIGTNTAVNLTHLVVNPEHLLYTQPREMICILDQIENTYPYLKFHYSLRGWVRKIKIAAALNSK